MIKYKSSVYHDPVVNPEVEKAVYELEGDSDIKSATVGGMESKRSIYIPCAKTLTMYIPENIFEPCVCLAPMLSFCTK